MKKSELRVGDLYEVMPSSGMSRRCVFRAPSGRDSILVRSSEIILLIAIQDVDEHSAYEAIALLGDQLLFVRPMWLKRIKNDRA